MKPTIVLVHGAFAESASWNDVIDSLESAGHPVIAAANPLRSLDGDAASVADLIRMVEGPVVLVAHSYGGAVISNVPADAGEITGLVYVNGFAPDPGESAFSLAGKFPGSMLGEETLRPVPRGDGTTDLYIIQDRFHELFCPDVPAPQAARMGATQRPATQESLFAPSGERPLWRELPSWFVIGREDRIIPGGASALHGRAGRRTPDARDAGRLPCGPRLAAYQAAAQHGEHDQIREVTHEKLPFSSGFRSDPQHVAADRLMRALPERLPVSVWTLAGAD